jgi:hypothetical protein
LEEHITSIFRVKEYAEQETSMKADGKQSSGCHLLGHEVDNSPLSSAKVKNMWSRTSISSYTFIVWCLIKHKDSLTFLPL